MSLKRKKPIGSADCWENDEKFPIRASANGSQVLFGLVAVPQRLPLKLMAPLGEFGREFWSFRLRAYMAPNLNVCLPACQTKLSEGEMPVVGASNEKYGPANWAGAAVGKAAPSPEKVTCGIPFGNLPALGKGSGILKP